MVWYMPGMPGTGHFIRYIGMGAKSRDFETLNSTDRDRRSLRLTFLGRLHQLLQLFSHFFPIRLPLILQLLQPFLLVLSGIGLPPPSYQNQHRSPGCREERADSPRKPWKTAAQGLCCSPVKGLTLENDPAGRILRWISLTSSCVASKSRLPGVDDAASSHSQDVANADRDFLVYQIARLESIPREEVPIHAVGAAKCQA
jgi:hypothetical protein